MFSGILTAQDYHVQDPLVRSIIDEEIRKELVHYVQNDFEVEKTKIGKTSQEETLTNLKILRNNEFTYLLAEDNVQEFDYEQEEKKHKQQEKILIEPEKFRVLGHREDPILKIRKPVFKLSDVYTTNNPKVRKIINRVFDQQIYGKHHQPQKTQGDVLTTKSASNLQKLEKLLQDHESKDEEYNFYNQAPKMNEQQLEDYIIDRGYSKTDFFLFYKNKIPAKIDYEVFNCPLRSQNFLKHLQKEVQRKEKQYYTMVDPFQPDENGQNEESEQTKKDQKKQKIGKEKTGKAVKRKKLKEYFGHFKRPGMPLDEAKIKMKDQFEARIQSDEFLAKSIIKYYSYIDSDILKQQYKKPQEQNDRLELNLCNPHFFQPKLHYILSKEKQLMQQNQFRAKLAIENKNKIHAQKSLLSGTNPKKAEVFEEINELDRKTRQEQEQSITIEAKIMQQIKNISKQVVKHSQVANKFQYIKFTLEQDAFSNYHRYFFPFHEHLSTNERPKIEIYAHKNRKVKPNGLVINAQMKYTNEKFAKKEDLSCSRGEFMIVQYIEETPLLLSNVGMCERMTVQVNYLQMLSKLRQQALDQKSFQEIEKQRDQKREPLYLSYLKYAQLWRKIIKDTFGDYGKQFYWQPKLNTGKVIGIPEGPGVIAMESNLGTVPIIKKRPNTRDFLLVREGNKWVLRKIQHSYVSGQIEPKKKVFTPGSRQHLDFKLSYEIAYILKQLKQQRMVNFDRLKAYFKGQSQNFLKKALNLCNAISFDSKNFKIIQEMPLKSQLLLTPQDICLYQKMQNSICMLKELGINTIRSNEKIKNVLTQFCKRHFESSQKIAIARVIREQLQLTSWFLTDSFIKYKQNLLKIEINGFADPTNGRGGYSFAHKSQNQLTAEEEAKQKEEKQKSAMLSELRKLNIQSIKQKLRGMGHTDEEIQKKSRHALIDMLKAKEGIEISRKQRGMRSKKIQQQRNEINRNFNRLLCWLRDETEEPAFRYSHSKANKLKDYILRQKEYLEKIRAKYGKKQLSSVVEQSIYQQSDGEN